MGRVNAFRFSNFSKKQKQVLTWWTEESGVSDYDGIIADGAIRSGKTVSMALSFVQWSMETFNGENFGMCGKTVGSFRRNVLSVLKKMLPGRGYRIHDKRSENIVIISRGNVENYYYVFGGKDESSQDLIQGITFAGILLDEVALMPKSFVDQATGRCSVAGSKLWFNCNPQGPQHWFKTEWIDDRQEKNVLYLHFTQDDNLSLPDKIKARYKTLYAGIFYNRFIKGEWAAAEGLVYPMFDNIVPTVPRAYEKYYISMDYGILNTTAMTLWGLCDGVWYAVREYGHSGRDTKEQKTDAQYYEELIKLAGKLPIKNLIIDPSASSFITLVEQKHEMKVLHANNAVLEGIQHTAQCLHDKRIMINDCCTGMIKEFGLYRWDEKAVGEDKVIKAFDHFMDELRYFVQTVRVWDNKPRRTVPGLIPR